MKNMKYLIFTIPFYLIVACGTVSNDAVDREVSVDKHTCSDKCTEGKHNCGEHCGCGDGCQCTKGSSCSSMCKPKKS